MKTQTRAVGVVLSFSVITFCVFGLSILPATGNGKTLAATPSVFPLIIWGMVYEADGVTQVTSCVVNVTDKNTGDWGLTMTGDTDGAYVFYAWDFDVAPGHVFNVTATKGDVVGWNEAVPPSMEPFNIDVIMSVTKTSFVLRLAQGWNMVCLPFINLSYTANTLGLENGSLVAGLNSSNQQYDEAFIVGLSPLSKDFAVHPSTGYWIYASAPTDLTLRGTVSSNETRPIVVPLGGGWVMFGLASLTPRHASEIPAMYSGGDLIIVCSWDPIRVAYQSYIPEFPVTDFIIYPGVAFLGYVSASGTFSHSS